MEAIAVEGYGSDVMDLRHYIRVVRGGLPLDLAEALIETFAQPSLLNASHLGGRLYRPDIRNSSQLAVLRTAREVGLPGMRSVARKLQNQIFDWMGAYQAALGRYLGLVSFSEPQLIRYRPGEYFAIHSDVPSPKPRLISAVALLSSDFSGGELQFFESKLSLDLEAGDVCLFPSNHLYPHQVTPVTAGDRYSVVTFLR